MPAVRSRTENWRRSLEQLRDRGGSLEISVAAPRPGGPVGNADAGATPDTLKSIIWRVRLLDVNDTQLVVEPPSSLGREFRVEPGVALVGVIAIGQNRWMFNTVCRGETTASPRRGVEVRGLALDIPTTVERCQRRNFYRVSTQGLDLPKVELFPLLEPRSVADVGRACRQFVREVERAESITAAEALSLDALPLPAVGPVTPALLVNIGGGGAGVVVEGAHASGLESHQHYWMRVGLTPFIVAPLAVSARLRHTHIDSAQRVYAGLQFDFSYDAEHQSFIIDQLCRYVALLQRSQTGGVPYVDRRKSDRGAA